MEEFTNPCSGAKNMPAGYDESKRYLPIEDIPNNYTFTHGLDVHDSACIGTNNHGNHLASRSKIISGHTIVVQPGSANPWDLGITDMSDLEG